MEMCNNKNIIEVNEKDKIEEDEIGNGKMEEEMWWNIEKVMRWKMNGELVRLLEGMVEIG